MTLRLVGLMSVVLLLSLAAFGLVMNHYHDQVMQEVAHTASDVGRETLRAFEFSASGKSHAFGTAPPASGLAWVGNTASTEAPGASGEPPRGIREQRLVVTMKTEDVQGTHDLTAINGAVQLLHDRECPEAEMGAECVRIQRWAQELSETGEAPGAAHDTFFINLEDVHAVQAGQFGLMLKFPTLTTREAGAHVGEPLKQDWHYKTSSDDEGNQFLAASGDEIQLPIEIGDYTDLYRSLRDRSLFLFLGVFLVGTVLSAGLASRFTRPIRRLDAGIRQISDGDLDVEVEAQGDDEIARLGMAFNEMTRKLRKNRDRGREMVRREKLSALGGLAAGVAHDVRNPLHSIGLTLQHLRDTSRPESPERAEEFDRSMDIIRGEIRRLDQTVANFLRFSRSERRERQPVDLADLLNDTARLVRKEAEWRKIDIRIDALSTVPAVSAEGESLRASVLNLVLNAFEAMPEGGTLKLTLRIDRDAVIIEVEDNGRGIPADALDKVFEFAYTTREGGNGVGLAMVHHCVVEEHGGKVSIESEVGQGTVVRLALPIRAPEREEQA